MRGGDVAPLVALCLALLAAAGRSQPSDGQLVPAVFTFGDSSVDVGNNNHLLTLFKANYPPYGRDFAGRKPTGRFCNGKLATDIIVDILGFSRYPPAYLSPEASGKSLLIGANFASAGSGYYDITAELSLVISLSRQLEYFKEYQQKLAAVAGSNASSILSGGLYIVSSGSNDFLQNYYVNPLLHALYTPDRFSALLVGIFSNFIQDLYALGARRIGVTSLPPLGCVPAAITLFGLGSNECVSRINADARGFNRKMNASVTSLSRRFSDLKIALLDVYTPLLELVRSPSNHGFAEARRGCCGTGLVETTTLLCNPWSPGTCANATEYVFFDGVHPSQSANQVLADALIGIGIGLVT